MLPGDRLLCLLLDGGQPGDRFRHWPLHVTIMPWFRLPDSSAQLARGLTRALQAVPAITVAADGVAYFGPRRRKVRLLEESSVLRGIE